MKGKYNVIIYDNKIKYNLELERKITIIKGKSGTGKTTLYTMFEDLVDKGKNVGIHCNCREKLAVLRNSSNWEQEIRSASGKIFIADEHTEYIDTQAFAEAVRGSDNYFILISRSGRFKWLTYSVESVFELGTEKEGNISVTKLHRQCRDR